MFAVSHPATFQPSEHHLWCFQNTWAHLSFRTAYWKKILWFEASRQKLTCTSSNTTLGMDFDFPKLTTKAKYRVLPFHLHVFRWSYHLATQVSRHLKPQLFTALIMHYRKNSIQGFTEAKALAVPAISVGQTLTTTPSGWHTPEF